MSLPNNPLDTKHSYLCNFVLVAFPTTTDAESAAQDISLEDGPEGAVINGGVVVLNDSIEKGIAPSRFMVKDFRYEYVWTGNHINTTISGGSLLITDTSGGEYLTFLKENVIDELKTSLENITFVLRIYWSKVEDDGDAYITCQPLFFSMSQIEHRIARKIHTYDCDIVPLFNTKAQYTSYNRIYGMNITHKDGNIHEEIPTAEPSGGSIKPRGAEDREKTNSRKNRIDKSKPMQTLNDVFEAFEKELNESINIHQGQLQEWQKVIRDDYKDKLKKPKQEKDLKIDYKILLEDEYPEYSIDNRNLPFEQPEQRQNQSGIRTIATTYGEKIDDVVNRLMSYSKKVGDEAGELPAKDYKICKVWRRIGENVKYDIVVKKYKVPYNPADGSINTGSGEGAVSPITFYFKSSGDIDVIGFDGMLHRIDGLKVVEDVNDNETSRLSFGAEREPITAEREPDTPFFETGYSGNRAKISNNKVLGLEYPKQLAQLLKKKNPIQNIQQSSINITIPGNPELLSDIMRQPTETAEGMHSDPQHYSRPEVLPMYAKILIEHEPLNEEDIPSSPAFYHKEWMHIYKIENIITGGAFFQKITLMRSDDLV